MAERVGIGASNFRLCRRRDVGIESGGRNDEMREDVGRKLEWREAELLLQYCVGSNTAVAVLIGRRTVCCKT